MRTEKGIVIDRDCRLFVVSDSVSSLGDDLNQGVYSAREDPTRNRNYMGRVDLTSDRCWFSIVWSESEVVLFLIRQ